MDLANRFHTIIYWCAQKWVNSRFWRTLHRNRCDLPKSSMILTLDKILVWMWLRGPQGNAKFHVLPSNYEHIRQWLSLESKPFLSFSESNHEIMGRKRDIIIIYCSFFFHLLRPRASHHLKRTWYNPHRLQLCMEGFSSMEQYTCLFPRNASHRRRGWISWIWLLTVPNQRICQKVNKRLLWPHLDIYKNISIQSNTKWMVK